MDRLRTILFLVAAMLFAPSQIAAQIKVGFIGGFSGPGRIFGEGARNGFELAREELRSTNVSVVYEDDQFDPKKTVAAFNKLTMTNKVDLVITLGSTPAAAIAPIAESRGVPLVAWASAKDISTGKKWVIRSWASGEEEGRALAEEAAARGLKRVGTLAYSDVYATSLIEGFVKGFGASAVALGEVASAENDFMPFILHAKRKGLDGLAVCLSVGQGARLALQLRQLDFNVTLLGCETFNSSSEVGLSRGALRGAMFASVPIATDFKMKYRARFKDEASISGAAIHYEIYRLLSEVFSTDKTKEEILKRLLSVRGRESVLGRFDIVAEGGDQWFRLPITVQMVSE